MVEIIVDSSVFIDTFQKNSRTRSDSIAFIDHLVSNNQIVTMPAHGWFEVSCNIKRLSDIERKYLPPIFAGKMQCPFKLIHIDAQFIEKYGNVIIPYTKAADHIFIVVAFVNKYPLVTYDEGMRKIAKELKVPVYYPKEFLSS